MELQVVSSGLGDLHIHDDSGNVSTDAEERLPVRAEENDAGMNTLMEVPDLDAKGAGLTLADLELVEVALAAGEH